ncbi:MAG: DUF983 domain-containing protein [Rhodospirillales bacterium]|nr:DUF983 domain-containing protein [Rhodospirillales bacterium]
MNQEPSHSLARLLWTGFRGRCPRCGRGNVFRGFLDIHDACPACGLALGGHDAGDGPAVAGTFLIGGATVFAAGWVEFHFSPPLWLHVALWIPVVFGGSAAILRPLKGLSVALQYRYRSTESPPVNK